MDIELATEFAISRSPQLSSGTLVNLFVERQLPESKGQAPLFGAPGITTLEFPVADGVHRGSWIFEGSGYFVIGTELWMYDTVLATTPVLVAAGITGVGRVSMSDNGVQLCIVNGTDGWIYTTGGGLVQITDPAFYPAVTVTFMDGYFIFDRKGTNEWFLSALYDGLVYNGLDFASAEAQPGTVTATAQNLQLLFVFCSGHIEIWYDAGTSDFPFARYSGGILNYGCLEPYTICNQDGALFFLGADLIFYRLQANVPIRVSTHPLENVLFPTADQNFAYWTIPFTTQGHKMVALTALTQTPALASGGGSDTPSTAHGIMTAEENYPADIVAEWGAGTQPNFCFCDKQYIGTSFDRVRRKIFYSAVVTAQTPDVHSKVTEPNTTGQTLWSGLNCVTPTGTIDLQKQFVYQTATKSIDTRVVTFYDPYDPTKLVPAGIGAGGIGTFTISRSATTAPDGVYEGLAATGGTGQSAVATLTVVGGAVTNVLMWAIGFGFTNGDVLSFPLGSAPQITLTSVNTGSDGTTWGRSTFDSTLSGSDVLGIVNPWTGDYWVHMQSCELYLFRAADDFKQVISPLSLPFTFTQNANAAAQPIGMNFDWLYFWSQSQAGVNKLQIVPTTITPAEVAADYLLATYTYAYPNDTYFYRPAIGPDGNLYIYGNLKTGVRAYKLWKCVPGIGFTEITPWSSSTGPNTNCVTWQTNTSNTDYSKNYVIQLPASNELALISKLFPTDTALISNPANFRIDLTYYNIVTHAFDYHEGFVTGYMDADWNPVTLGDDVWVVTDFKEMDNDLEVSNYVHAGIDYSTRVFMFVCRRGTLSTLENYTFCVFVTYHFTSGSAPTVVSIVAESDANQWDDAYLTYATDIDAAAVVSESLPVIAHPGVSFYTADFAMRDNGIWDRTTGAYWLSGDQPQFCRFNSDFANRETQSLASWGAAASAASPPFLRLTVDTENPPTPPGPPAAGYFQTYCWDISTSKWHQRRSYQETIANNFDGWRASTILPINGYLLVGDLLSSKIGFLDWRKFTEFDTQITGVVQTTNQHKDRHRIYCSRFELTVQAGVGDATTPDPQITLKRSVDGGMTWTNPSLPRSMGGVGEYGKRLRWMGQGQGRQMMWQLTITDPVQRVIIAANADLEEGM